MQDIGGEVVEMSLSRRGHVIGEPTHRKGRNIREFGKQSGYELGVTVVKRGKQM